MPEEMFKEITDAEILEMVEAARLVVKKGEGEEKRLAEQVESLGAALLKSRLLVHIRERMMATSKMYWVRAGEAALNSDQRELRLRVEMAKAPAVMAVLSRLTADT